MTIALSPDSVTNDDDISDDDSFSNFDVVPCNPNLGFALETQQGDTDRPSALKPIYSEDLRQIFAEYEKLLQRPAEKCEQRISPDHGSAISNPVEPKTRHQTTTNSKADVLRVTCKQRPGLLRGNAERVKKSIAATASQPGRKKRALASKIQEYKFMHLGDARRTANGSVEVEVFWAPMFLTCDQLRGEQALEEAKDLVVKQFGQAVWEREQNKLS